MRIVLLGPPGAGKGTQAVSLCERAGLAHISTGDMMRAAVRDGSEVGLQVKSYLDAGSLVPDALTIELVRQRVKCDDCRGGFVFDGFPRTVEQAKALDALLAELDRPLTRVVDIVVDEAVLMERIRKRGAEGSGRSDDTEEVAQKRLAVYREQTAPVARYYEEGIGVAKVQGVGTVDEVRRRIDEALGR